MFVWSAILFALAALGGLTLAVMHFRSGGRERPPTALAIGHGLAAAAALVLLIVGVLGAGAGAGASVLPGAALAIFVVAALGGAYLFFGKHLRGRPLPSAVVIIHGLVAVAGFLVLLAFLLTSPG